MLRIDKSISEALHRTLQVGVLKHLFLNKAAYCAGCVLDSACHTAWVWPMHVVLTCLVAVVPGCLEGSSALAAHGESAAFVHCLGLAQYLQAVSS